MENRDPINPVDDEPIDMDDDYVESSSEEDNIDDE